MASERQDQLSAGIVDSLAILARGAESVRAVMASEENRFTRALGDLQRLASAENMPLAIVGGLGRVRHVQRHRAADAEPTVQRFRPAGVAVAR